MLNAGHVHINRDENGERIDWSPVNEDLFAVLSSRKEPENAFVATRYRGYWYYIDSADIDSRETLTLLSAVFVLLAGGEPGGGPVLTLPVD